MGQQVTESKMSWVSTTHVQYEVNANLEYTNAPTSYFVQVFTLCKK